MNTLSDFKINAEYALIIKESVKRKLLLSQTKYVKRGGVLSDSLSRFLFKCSSNYLDYCGMEYSCVYVVNTKPKELIQRLVTMVRERR